PGRAQPCSAWPVGLRARPDADGDRRAGRARPLPGSRAGIGVSARPPVARGDGQMGWRCLRRCAAVSAGMVAAMSNARSLPRGGQDDGGAESSTQPRLVISLFGGGAFSFAGRDIALRNRKARAMLAYLALSERGEEQRERLAGLLWSESSEAHARATLRQ